MVVEPYVYSVYGTVGQDIASSNLWIASLPSAFIAVVLFAGLGRNKAKKVDIYLAGVSRDNAERTFRNSLSGESTASSRNWYLEGLFGEKRISPVGTVPAPSSSSSRLRQRPWAFRDCSRKGCDLI